MKHFYLFILLLVFVVYYGRAQNPTTPPSGCNLLTSGCGNVVDSHPHSLSPSMSVSGIPSITFVTIADFTAASITDHSIIVTINNLPKTANGKTFTGVYTLYVAGSIAYTGSLPDSPIPLGAFKVAASTPGAAPVLGVTLSNQYLPVATNVDPNSTTSETLTITLTPSVVPMNAYLQAPTVASGDHTLTIYLLFCNN